jgi:hypothetical protein
MSMMMEANPGITGPFMLDKNILHRVLQSCKHLYKHGRDSFFVPHVTFMFAQALTGPRP